MDKYPTGAPVDHTPTKVSLKHRNIVTNLETGREYRRSLWVQPQRRIELNYNALTAADAAKIRNFHNEQKGILNTFVLKFPHSEEFTKEYIGKGTGTKDTWRMPIYSYSWLRVYLDEIQLSSDAYTITTDADGFKMLTFNVTPLQDQVVTVDFQGIPQLYARFAEDELAKEIITDKLSRLTVTLLEVKTLND